MKGTCYVFLFPDVLCYFGFALDDLTVDMIFPVELLDLEAHLNVSQMF